MQTNISKWGNSLGIRIPRALAEEAGLTNGTAVDIRVEDDQIIVRRKGYDLNSLIDQITPDNIHDEVDTGRSLGAEVW